MLSTGEGVSPRPGAACRRRSRRPRDMFDVGLDPAAVGTDRAVRACRRGDHCARVGHGTRELQMRQTFGLMRVLVAILVVASLAAPAYSQETSGGKRHGREQK